MLRCLIAWMVLILVALATGCAGDAGPKPDSRAPDLPPPELDERVTADGFSIQPPRDWQVGESPDDWIIRPPQTHAEYVKAVAKIVISRESLPGGTSITSVEDFRDLVLAALKESSRDLDVKDVQTSTGEGGLLIVDVTIELQTRSGTSRHRILNEYSPSISTTGFWRASVSCWRGFWDRVSPMLVESLRTIRFARAPIAGRDLPPSMRD